MREIELLDFAIGETATGFFVRGRESDRTAVQRLVDLAICEPIEEVSEDHIRARFVPPGMNPHPFLEQAKRRVLSA